MTVLFDVSNKCNLRCRMCYFSYDSVFLRRAQYMTPETFERIARIVLPLAHTVFLSAGCESLTNPHFIEILRIAASFRPPQIKLLTNAILMGPAESSALVECAVTQVHVSVEGATRATYEHVRRGADFEVLKRNLACLQAIKRERNSLLPLVQFNVALMNSSLWELRRFVDLAIELGVDQIACRHLMPYVGLDMEGEVTASQPRIANERFHAFLEHATRLGVCITSFPDFFQVDDAPWLPPVRTIDEDDFTIGLSLAGAPRIEPERPFGRIDAPAASSADAAQSIEIAGWALDLHGVASVEVRREACASDPASATGVDGCVHVGWATIRNGSRPDVAAVYPRVPLAYRAGWAFELAGTVLPQPSASIRVVAVNRLGATSVLGGREITFRPGLSAQPFLFCRKPFDNVYIDAAGNVYPYPDCQTVDPFGSLVRESSFRAVWFGEEFRQLRRAIVERDPPRMCLTCPDFINRSVDDHAFFSERPVEKSFRRPTGYLDDPHEVVSVSATATLSGWALGFAPVERIEISRDTRAGEAPSEDGHVLVGSAAPGTEVRPDVTRAYAHYPGCERAGWRFVLPRSELPDPGPFEIHVTAVSVEGTRTLLGTARVRFVESPPTRRERARLAGAQ